MSSFKKASKLNQKTHRERHQPKAREKLGFLEKKQDYKQRSNNRQEKEETLKLLRKRALNKNPDEFYHHMINSKIQKEEHYEKEKDEDITEDQIKLMETQDKKYINMKRTVERRKIDRLRSQLHMTEDSGKTKNKHIFFVDSEKDAKKFDLASQFSTFPEFLNRKSNLIKVNDLEKMKLNLDNETIVRLNLEREKSYKELEKRKGRERELAKVQRKLEMKNLTKQQRRVFKSKDLLETTKSNHPIFKFKYERKK